MVLNAQELRKKIEEYFKTVTKDQLLKDLVDSGLEVYSKSEYKITEYMQPERKEEKVIVHVEVANNVDIFCQTMGGGKNIVRATYLFGMGTTRSANKETNITAPKTAPTSASSVNINWS